MTTNQKTCQSILENFVPAIQAAAQFMQAEDAPTCLVLWRQLSEVIRGVLV